MIQSTRIQFSQMFSLLFITMLQFYIIIQALTPPIGVLISNPSAPIFVPNPRKCTSRLPSLTPTPVLMLGSKCTPPTGPRLASALINEAPAQAPNPGPATAEASDEGPMKMFLH